jgi:sec-independent protein translocase protein TatC
MKLSRIFSIRKRQKHSVDGSMTFIEHLEEFRRRLIICVIALMASMFGCLAFAPKLFVLLQIPLAKIPDHKLIVLSPLEYYIVLLKLALVAGLFVVAPVILFQVWRFVAPGLKSNEKRFTLPFIILGSLFFIGGGMFGFLVVLPMGFDFLISIMPDTIDATYSVAIYFSFVMRLILAFGCVFELPIVMWILSAAGIVAPKTYSKFRRYWIVLAFIIGAILTPPDPLTQVLMTIPLLVFFDIGALGARFLYKKHAQPVS